MVINGNLISDWNELSENEDLHRRLPQTDYIAI